VMTAYAAFRMVGPINEVAAVGLVARKNRSIGPAKRRENAKKTRRAIWKRAKACWAEKPILRGDASNTAVAIAPHANEELRAIGLLSGNKALSAKTIADHIRAAKCGKSF
jgi:hypothetical protein